MDYIKENERRKQELNKPYNPLTGLNCVGNRKRLCLSDAPYPELFLPEAMFRLELVKELEACGSIKKFHKKHRVKLTDRQFELFWKDFCELRYSYDYEFYAVCTQTILHREKGKPVSFLLNIPQRIILSELEDVRLSGEPLRFNILKSRQFGSSTLIENYFEWIQVIHKTFWNSVICAHIQDPSKRIREMYERSIRNKPKIKNVKMTIRGFQSSQNIKTIPERGCTITVGTAQEPDGVRSDAVKLAHLSEVSLYPDTEANNAERLEASITGPIPEIPLTAIIRETTAKGQDYFYEQYQKAKNAETAYRNIFIEWFKMAEYAQPFNGLYSGANGRKKKGSVEDFVRTLNGREKILFENNKECTLEHLNWYRAKAGSMLSLSLMKQEFPSDDIEAFQFSGMPVFDFGHIEKQRRNCRPPEFIGNISSECPPALHATDPGRRKQILQRLAFVEDIQAMQDCKEGDAAMQARAIYNKLQIWELPDTGKRISNRYIVTFDPQKGLTESADFGVISVIDRYWRIFGGCDEVAAQWRGRMDKDIEIWIAAQIAKFYGNALLVVESNTYDSDSGQVDDGEYIFSVIADYYGNLYRREIKDKIKGGVSMRYGFVTNRTTKTSIIENYRAVLRDGEYMERDHACLDEARTYELNEKGKYEAKKNRHDDILMSRMIGLYVSSQLPQPCVINTNKQNNVPSPNSMAVI